MPNFITLKQIDETRDAIRARISRQPRISIILGSGLGPLAEEVQDAQLVPYNALPNWPVSTVQGHSGQLVVGGLEGKNVIIMQGRAHYYEGYSISEIGLPIRVMKRLGTDTLIVTNAAGAVNPDFQPGDLMLLTDHLNLLGMTGLNPLRGPNLEAFGPRFPDMSQAYSRELLEIARQSAAENNIKVREGVYTALAGPSFETPAELRLLRTAGTDAVGMSTVPEVIVARHSNMRVLGISGISNKSNLDGNTTTTHEEVLEAGRVIVPKLISLIRGVLRRC